MAGSRRLEGRLLQKAEQLLPRVADLLHRSGIDFCIDGGTLLGIYREGRLLPWDNDIDLFARAEDARRIHALRWRLLLMGCWIKVHYARRSFPSRMITFPAVIRSRQGRIPPLHVSDIKRRNRGVAFRFVARSAPNPSVVHRRD
ncbi:MAG: LicD family protein [Rhodobacteraceae bacterium]|nr:LicD family protein [Paracoccaceae bacterium]